MYLIEVLLAYVVADAAIDDRVRDPRGGVGPKWLVKASKWYHMHPESLVVDFNSAILGVPMGLVALLNWHPAFWVALGAFMSCSQIFHWCAHRVPTAARLLQRSRFVLTPEHHGEHHKNFQRNFCIVSGWNNWWLNYVLRALRAKKLEATLAAVRTLSEQRLHKLGARLEEAERQLERSQYYLNSWKLNSVAETQHWRERALAAERVATAVKEALRDDPQQSLSNLGGEVDATEKSVRTHDVHTPRGPYLVSHGE